MSDYGEDGLAIYEDGTRETQEDHNRLLEEEAARRGESGKKGHGFVWSVGGLAGWWIGCIIVSLGWLVGGLAYVSVLPVGLFVGWIVV